MASNASGRVRVVSRIRGPLNKEPETETLPVSKPWLLVSRPDPDSSCRVKISFTSDKITSGKQSYEVDECYEQAIENPEIFSKEMEHLVSGLFGGQNSTVFAFGPRGSGKTYTLQGSKEEFGLAPLTMDSILTRAKEEQKVVNVSVFEVCQDRITDLLDDKRSEVSVFEDAQGKIKLIGLSKVKVNTTSEFRGLYNDAANTRMQKATEPPHRSHIGCIFYLVTPQNGTSSAKLVGKINFVDLASYEDSRRKSSDGANQAETTKIKKSLNAVHNVLYALNANDRVPYRESKLTQMLKDSLGGSSRILMVTCMSPSFCQETVQTISVASRSCIAGFLAYLNPTKSRSASKKTGASSPQIMRSASKLSTRANLMSPKVLKPMTMSTSASARKHTTSHLSVRKASGGAGLQKNGRKLFVDINEAKTPKREKVSTVDIIRAKTPKQEKVNTVDINRAKTPKQEKVSTAAIPESPSQSEVNTQESEVGVVSSIQPEEKLSIVTVSSETDSSLLHSEKETPNAFSDVNISQSLSEENVVQVEGNVTATPFAFETPTTESGLVEGKENKLHEGLSPPLSARLRELSNNLKSLSISTEANLKMTQDSSMLFNQVIREDMEPKTPSFKPSVKAYENYDKASPWTGMKDSIVQEYLRFLNSASKEELKTIKGIGEKRATNILELRKESPERFKELDDLKDIGLSEKQIKGLMKKAAGNLFA